MDLLGVRLVGFNHESLSKLALTVVLVGVLFGATALLRGALRHSSTKAGRHTRFWLRQAVSLLIAVIGVFGLAAIWFDDPRRLSTVIGLVTAGLAFAMQKVVTSFAGYFLILRGKNFTIGDRIVMGGVRGNVIGLGFFQTTIMEMGQPASVQNADPAMWVKSRQFTGRIVTVANSRIFDDPVYNYTREFPFIWEEMTLPVRYTDDRAQVERILLQAAQEHAAEPGKLDAAVLDRIQREYAVQLSDFEPHVYWQLTDNWLAMTVRFLVPDHGIRERKDAMSRRVIAGLDQAGIGLASATSEIVGLPPLTIRYADRESDRS